MVGAVTAEKAATRDSGSLISSIAGKRSVVQNQHRLAHRMCKYMHHENNLIPFFNDGGDVFSQARKSK
jgi:hypothetical protein